MAVKDYNVDPDLNTTISGINIAEGCAPSGINNAIRQLMADVKEGNDALDSTLRAFIAQEVAKAMATASAAQSSADAKVSALEALLRDLIEDEKATLEAQIQNTVPAGTVVAFAANSTPDGYLLCNGAAVSRTTYAKLYEAIGTTYGKGDGSTTFNLPNLTDRFIQGSGTAGTKKDAGLPEIAGDVESNDGYGPIRSVVPSGAFGYGSTSRKGLAGESYSIGWGVTFAASRSNSIYGKSNTVQPPALTMRYYIKY